MIENLRHLKNTTNKRVLGVIIKSESNQELFNWIISQTAFLPPETKIVERVYVILNPADSAICKFNNKKSFQPGVEKWGFCSSIDRCACFKEHYNETHKPLADETIQTILEKRKETWLKKYGSDNPSKHDDIKQKRKATMKTRSYTKLYSRLKNDKLSDGYDQIVERVKEFVTPNFTKEEYKGSFRKNFYTWICNQCSNEIIDHVDYGRVPRCLSCWPNGESKVEKILTEYIESFGIKVERHNKSLLGNLELDIWIPSKKIAIEYNGVYWHSTEWKDSKYHVNKFIKCRELGIHLIQLFEDEWNTKPEIIKARLLNVLGLSNRIYARKCIVAEVPVNDYKEFVAKHHLQGFTSATQRFGLYYQNSLVAVMGFSKSRYSPDGYELIRYCSDGTIIGGASKLFSHFIKTVNPDKIISYASRCWSTGNLYTTLGFKNVTENDTNTGFWYIKNNIRYHRSTFTKARLLTMNCDPLKTADQIMKDAGYLKVYDCGNYKFEWAA